MPYKRKFVVQAMTERVDYAGCILVTSENKDNTLQDLIEFLNEKELDPSRIRLVTGFNVIVRPSKPQE
jgi:hypothetical protein